MDDLARIESIYGSVAEYNRVRYEEDREYQDEMSDEQILENEVSMDVYHEKIRLLNGEPSQFAVNLRNIWAERMPKEEDYDSTNDYIYDLRDIVRQHTLQCFDRICDYYGLKYDEEYATFYRTKPDSFAISVEYNTYGEIKHKHVGNLDYDTFKNVFRDFYEMGLSPTMNYCDHNGKNLILSNCSLGNLRVSDLKWIGLETDEGLNAELKSLGFNEKEYIDELVQRIMKEREFEVDDMPRQQTSERDLPSSDFEGSQMDGLGLA